MSDRSCRWVAGVVAGVVALLCLVSLGDTVVRQEAEQRNQAVVHTMLSSGNYLVPYYEQEIRVQKPPLFYWASAISQKLLGEGLFGFRFPSVIFALLTLCVTWLWARELDGNRLLGTISVALLGSTYLFLQYARLGTYEMPLTFFCSASLLAAYLARKHHDLRFGLLAGLLFGCAFLAKGTPVLAVMVLPLVLWMVGMGEFRSMFRLRVMVVALLALAISVSWYVVLLVLYPEARAPLVEVLLLPFGVDPKNIETGARHYEAPWFYLKMLPRDGIPLALFIPATALFAWRRRMWKSDSGERLQLLGFVIPFAVFSLIPQKQDHYLLPLLPPLAIIASRTLVDTFGAAIPPIDRRWVVIPIWIMVLFGILAGIALIPALSLMGDVHRVLAVLLGVSVLLCAIAGTVALKQRKGRMGLAAGVAVLMMAWLAYFGAIHPVEEAFGSGACFRDKTFDMSRWDRRFAKYPYLKKLLDVERGRKRANKADDNYF